MKTFGQILTNYRKAAGLTQIDVAGELTRRGMKVNSGAVCTWEKDTVTPDAKQFLALCEILGIHNIYNEFIGYDPEDPFAKLNSEGVSIVLKIIHILEKSGEYTKEENRTIIKPRVLPFYDLPVSAGTGNFLDGEDYTYVEVGTDVSLKAEYGLRISGDSMEPRFVNGQIVWIQPTDELTNGEIGIFFLDGSAYIKKFDTNKKGTRLVSLNTKYAPIELNENSNFKILGRVV